MKDKELKQYSYKRTGIKVHCRRIFILILYKLFCYDWIFALVGKINFYFSFINSVFLAYPATDDYALAYVYERHLLKMKWNPHLAGFIWQNRKLELMFVVSSTEEDFTNSTNTKNLEDMTAKMEKVRMLLNACQKRFAGILPGVLLFQRLIRHSVEAEVTVKAIKLAVKKVERLQKYDSDVPLIILGKKGFIGRKLIKAITKNNRRIYCLDVNSQLSRDECFRDLRGEKVIVINVTRKAVLFQYLSVLWPESIILNEVYPEPTEKELAIAKERNLICYHIVGVKARAFPSFPRAYHGGIPCCAAWPSQEMEVIIRKLI